MLVPEKGKRANSQNGSRQKITTLAAGSATRWGEKSVKAEGSHGARKSQERIQNE